MRPADGRMIRAYDLFFLTGEKILYGKTAVNTLLAKIEAACKDNLDIDRLGRITTVREIHPKPRMEAKRGRESVADLSAENQNAAPWEYEKEVEFV